MCPEKWQRLAARLDFTTRVIDERPELLTRERFPTADELICDSYDNLEQHLEPGPAMWW